MRGPGHALSEHLQRSLATTNAAESLLGRTCYIKRNVKRWHERGMVRRWIAAGVFEVTKGFHRVKGCKDMYRPRVLGQWFDGIRIYAAASSPTRSRRTCAGLR